MDREELQAEDLLENIGEVGKEDLSTGLEGKRELLDISEMEIHLSEEIEKPIKSISEMLDILESGGRLPENQDIGGSISILRGRIQHFEDDITKKIKDEKIDQGDISEEDQMILSLFAKFQRLKQTEFKEISSRYEEYLRKKAPVSETVM